MNARRQTGTCGGFVVLAMAAVVPAGADADLFVVGSDATGGDSDVLQITAPWTASQSVEPVGRDATVRHFYGRHYVIDPDEGTVQVIDAGTLDTIVTFSVGADSLPQDVLVVSPNRAYVSRYDSTLLYEVDPTDGTLSDSIDLGGFADADGIPDMSMLAIDGNRLFAQIQRLDRVTSGVPMAPSYLAVVDVRTNQLIDVDPAVAGVQGIALSGTNPSHKMQVDSVERRLYVSTPGLRLEVSGGIEEIDLDALTSLGFVYPESRASIDLGGFVMITADSGYVIGHTDIVASSHLIAFHRDPEVPGQGEIHTSLFVFNDNLAYDSVTGQLFYPDATASPPGIHVFEAATGTRLTAEPVATAKPPVDLVVARPVTPGEALGVRVDGIDTATGELSIRYDQACGATNHNIVLGPLSGVSGYAYTDQVCGIGTSGVVDAFATGPGSFFFIVVGTDGAGRDGSYGRGQAGLERPEDLLDPLCAFVQDLGDRCD